tara:strand:+ start:308 stop:442 length:135 start_codon:yes stop_codon:yes gene_type:complete
MRPSKANKQKRRKLNEQLKSNGRTPNQIARKKKKKDRKNTGKQI